ncbi:unnamed protein product, partial [Strongylus vulgaris]
SIRADDNTDKYGLAVKTTFCRHLQSEHRENQEIPNQSCDKAGFEVDSMFRPYSFAIRQKFALIDCSCNIYYYECVQDGPYVKSKPKGCVSHNKQKRVPIGERDDFGDYT